MKKLELLYKNNFAEYFRGQNSEALTFSSLRKVEIKCKYPDLYNTLFSTAYESSDRVEQLSQLFCPELQMTLYMTHKDIKQRVSHGKQAAIII